VNLIPWPDERGEAGAYARLDGACCPRWRSAPRDELVARVFILYAKLVLHGFDPVTAHLALYGLAEYRDNLPPELAVRRSPPARSAGIVRLEDYRNPLPAPARRILSATE
jgi:hypothetical protein